MIILQLENIKFSSINRAYKFNSKTKRMYLDKNYTDFKKLLIANMKNVNLDPPYVIKIETACYHDIDNPIKCILDSLETKGIIDNDRNILQLDIIKYPIAKNKPGHLIIEVIGRF